MSLVLASPIKREYNSRELIYLADIYYHQGIEVLKEVLNDYRFLDFSNAVVIDVKKGKNRVTEVSTGKKIKYLSLISNFDKTINTVSSIKTSSDKFLEIQYYAEARYKNLIRNLKDYIKEVLCYREEVLKYIEDTLSSNRYTSFKWLYSLNSNNRYLLPLCDEKRRANINGAARYYMERGIKPYEYEYSLELLQTGFNGYDKNRCDRLFVGEDAIISNTSFEVMANIYELIYNLNEIKDELEIDAGKKRVKSIK